MNDLAIFIWHWYVPADPLPVLQGFKDKGFTVVATAQRHNPVEPVGATVTGTYAYIIEKWRAAGGGIRKPVPVIIENELE